MTKKVKEVKSEEKLNLDNISVGDKILDLHDEEVEITEDLIEQMRRFEQETNKSVIWRNKITGTFLFYKWYEDHPEEKLKTKKKPGRKPKKAEELIEEEVDEEELDEEEIEAEIEADELEEIEEAIEEKVVDEENLLKDAIADFKSEFNIKGKVNTNTKKFKKFFEEWKKAE